MRSVLITGGTSGIGRALALAFAAADCQVVATGLTDDEVQAAAPVHQRIHNRRLDVTDEQAIASLVQSLPQLDVLINAAGTILRHGQEHHVAGFARVIDVNLNGMMRMCAAALPRLIAARGCVINLASMLSFFGSGYVPAYSASKGGVVQLTRSLAIAWAAHGIRVNAIAPGWIETPLTAPLYRDPERRDEMIRRTPLGRWGQPEDVSGATLFLASPAAAFITGVVLPVDGGYSIA